jgi:hypothetical protein
LIGVGIFVLFVANLVAGAFVFAALGRNRECPG